MGLMIAVAFWDLIWKGIALWRAAKRREVGWFVALLLLNTAGVLPILYLLFTSDPDKKTGIVKIEHPAAKEESETKASEKTSPKKKAATKKVAKKSTKKSSSKKSSASTKSGSKKK